MPETQRLGLPYEEALTHREIAGHTEAEDPRREIFQRLGAADSDHLPGE